ncbi:MAG: hypothetical protein ACREBR_03530 [bacterium]
MSPHDLPPSMQRPPPKEKREKKRTPANASKRGIYREGEVNVQEKAKGKKKQV